MHTEVPVIYATASGGTTFDQDAYGGNPFATALIEENKGVGNIFCNRARRKLERTFRFS